MGCLGFGNVPIADGKPDSLEVDVAESMRLLLPPGSTQPRAFHRQDVEAWSNIGKKSKKKFQTPKFEERARGSLGILARRCDRNVLEGTKCRQKNASIESGSWRCQSHSSRPASIAILSNKGTPGIPRRPNDKMSSKLSSRSSSTLATSPAPLAPLPESSVDPSLFCRCQYRFQIASEISSS